MQSRGRMFFILMVATFVLSLGSGSAAAQEKFPSRPIQFIVSWATGGAATLHAQVVQPHFQKAIGGSTQIINKPGGGGTIGWNYIANSPPDGYTVGVINPSLLITQYTTSTGVSFKKLDPIIVAVDLTAALAVRADAPWKTFKEFISYARANPEKVQMGNSGMGAVYHISALGIEMVTGSNSPTCPLRAVALPLPLYSEVMLTGW